MSTSYFVKVEEEETYVTEDLGDALGRFFYEMYARGAEHIELVYSA